MDFDEELLRLMEPYNVEIMLNRKPTAITNDMEILLKEDMLRAKISSNTHKHSSILGLRVEIPLDAK
jgi:hypothetical protein